MSVSETKPRYVHDKGETRMLEVFDTWGETYHCIDVVNEEVVLVGKKELGKSWMVVDYVPTIV